MDSITGGASQKRSLTPAFGAIGVQCGGEMGSIAFARRTLWGEQLDRGVLQQFVQRHLGGLQVGRVKTLAEPIVDFG